MPASQPPKSLQEILRQRQQSEFVGRDDYLNTFSHNLKVPLDDNQRRFLFNAWGQGGVGKSTLLKQFSKSAQDAKAAVAYTDESETSVPEAMGRLAEQFTEQGYKLNQFTDRYRLYRQRQQELETDPEAPQGFSAFVGKTVVKAGVKLGRRVPVGGAVLDLVDEDVLSTQAGEWASYVAKKLRNKDEVHLVQEPITVLTPLFLQDLCTLAQQACVALFFDTYEQTDEFLDPWLRDVLEGKHGDVPSNIVITIAGRHPLADNHWAAYDGLIARFPLEPFTEDEAKQFLHRKGITNARVVEMILHLSGKLPLLMAMLAVGSPDDPDQVGDPSDTAVERFLKWVEDPKQRQIALAAALPRKFNRDIIAELTSEEDADALFAWLKGMPFVKEQRDAWVYHQVVRGLMLRYQRLASPKNWEAAQGQLAAYFDQCWGALDLEDDQQKRDPDWQHYRLEALYHWLCGAPRAQLKSAINDFLAALKNQRSFAAQWAEVMAQAGEDSDSQSLQDWGKQLMEGLRAYAAEEYAAALEMFSKLLKDSMLEPRWHYVALAWRGNIYRLMGACEDALKDLNQALEVEPDDVWAIARRGLTYQQMGRYEEALTDLTCAIELKPDDAWTIAYRSSIYAQMERFEETLTDLTCAIELQPNYECLIGNRGEIYKLLQRYEEALPDLSRAIELNPDDARMMAIRGEIYRLMERHSEALTDLTGAIELKPDYERAIANRGVTYQQMEHYEEALSDLNCAIELKPDYEWALANRGLIYRFMERHEEALSDFSRSIELDPTYDLAIANRGITYLLIDHYEEALADFSRAIELKSDYDSVIALRGATYQQMERYEEALADLTHIIELKPDDEWVIAKRGETYRQMERFDEALADLSRAIDLSPTNNWNFDRRGKTYQQIGSFKEAISDFSHSLNSKESDWTFYERGLAHRKLNQPAFAQKDFQRAIQLVQQDLKVNPDDVQNLFNLAIYFLGNGQYDLSRQTYQQGLNREPTLAQIREAVQDLSDFLKLFPGHSQATAFYNGLRKKLEFTPQKYVRF